jgi:pilus assembly protein Flp/PilA
VSLKGDAWLKNGRGNLFGGVVVPLTAFFSLKMIYCLNGQTLAACLRSDWADLSGDSVPLTYCIRGRILKMKNILKKLWQEEEGQDLVEYGLLVVLIALFAIAAMGKLGSAVSNVFSSAAANLTTS